MFYSCGNFSNCLVTIIINFIIVLRYATNRKPVNEDGKDYNTNLDIQMHYGRTQIFIQQTHRKENSFNFFRWLFSNGDETKMTYFSELKSKFYFEILQSLMADPSRGDKSALLYVHGYNTTFKHVRALGQIASDIGYEGITTCFSWASAGQFTEYEKDQATAEQSAAHLAEYINQLYNSGVQTIHIIGHSLGGRCILKALQHVKNKYSQIEIAQLVLIAADIEINDLKCISTLPKCLKITFYYCEYDIALKIGQIFKSYPAIGASLGNVTGIDCVKIPSKEAWNTAFLHCYHISARSVVNDFAQMIHYNAPASKRVLKQCTTELGTTYYEITM